VLVRFGPQVQEMPLGPTPGNSIHKAGIAAPQLEGNAPKHMLHPQAPSACAGSIVRAHTIQRAGHLDRIARDRHVYTFRQDLMSTLDREPLRPRLVGFRVASTFTGFCSRHDTELFRALETEGFTGTPEQCLLLACRSTCRELYAKQGTLALEETLRQLDRGRPLAVQQAVQARMSGLLAGTALAMEDLRTLKVKMETCILASESATVHAYVIFLGTLPELMVSAMLNPEYDFDGRVLQSFASRSPLEWLSFSVIATDTGGAVVVTWLGQSPVADRLVDSLNSISDSEVGDAIVRLAFEMSEDVYAHRRGGTVCQMTNGGACCIGWKRGEFLFGSRQRCRTTGLG